MHNINIASICLYIIQYSVFSMCMFAFFVSGEVVIRTNSFAFRGWKWAFNSDANANIYRFWRTKTTKLPTIILIRRKFTRKMGHTQKKDHIEKSAHFNKCMRGVSNHCGRKIRYCVIRILIKTLYLCDLSMWANYLLLFFSVGFFCVINYIRTWAFKRTWTST